MTEPIIIPRDRELPQGQDQDFLFHKGMELVQELASTHWTDYNLHDPGITILEIISYALTELDYKASFPMADLLTREDGIIDPDSLALYSARSIFCMHPVTLNDFRKFITDSSEHIRNAWIVISPEGRMDIDLYLDEEASPEQEVKNLEEKLLENRNLGDRFGKISVLRKKNIALRAAIYLESLADAEQLVASALGKIAAFLSPVVPFHSLAEMLQMQMKAEEIFSGPALRYGFIIDRDLQDLPVSMADYEVIPLMKSSGISQVESLSWTDSETGAESHTFRLEPGEIACLDIDRTLSLLDIYIKGNKIHLHSQQIKNHFKEWQNRHYRYSRLKLNLNQLDFAFPKGNYRRLGQYDTIQQEFPEVYGINRTGLTPDAGSMRRAQAMQLKAYLLFMEQVMANYLGQISHIPALFSTGPQQATYFFNPVYDIPEIEKLIKNFTDHFPEDPEEWDKYKSDPSNTFVKSATKKLLKGEDFYKRRNAFLDFLLSIFAEKISLYGKETPGNSIGIKEKLLQLYPMLSAGRGKAVSGHNMTGPEVFLRILLNIPQPPETPIHQTLAKYLQPEKGHMKTSMNNNHADQIYRLLSAMDDKNNYIFKDNALWIKLNAHSEFRLTAKEKHKDPQDIQQLHEAMKKLNFALDNFYVIDHDCLQTASDRLPEDFYRFGISYVFPSFSSRFGEKGFREYVISVIYRYTPAHMTPYLLWLDPDKLETFENIYHPFRSSINQTGTTNYMQLAEALSLFLSIYSQPDHA